MSHLLYVLGITKTIADDKTRSKAEDAVQTTLKTVGKTQSSTDSLEDNTFQTATVVVRVKNERIDFPKCNLLSKVYDMCII